MILKLWNRKMSSVSKTLNLIGLFCFPEKLATPSSVCDADKEQPKLIACVIGIDTAKF
jgi:hypothetical protein